MRVDPPHPYGRIDGQFGFVRNRGRMCEAGSLRKVSGSPGSGNGIALETNGIPRAVALADYTPVRAQPEVGIGGETLVPEEWAPG